MNCNEASEYMMKHLDGIINDIERAQLKQHLKTCTHCSQSFEGLKEIFGTLEMDSGIEPPQDFEVQVMEKINALDYKSKKRTDSVLVFAYSFVTLVLTALSIVFMAKFNGVNIYEIIKGVGSSFGSVPEAIVTIFSIAGAIYNLAVRIVEIMFQVLSTLVSTYYFVLAAVLIVFLMLQRFIFSYAKNFRRDR